MGGLSSCCLRKEGGRDGITKKRLVKAFMSAVCGLGWETTNWRRRGAWEIFLLLAKVITKMFGEVCFMALCRTLRGCV